METDDIEGLAAEGLKERVDAAGIQPDAWLLASDVEGPLFLGDFIAEALSTCLKPSTGGIDAAPSYGQILYGEGYAAFSADTAAMRRPEGARCGKAWPEGGYTLAQEGTDTIFALPLLLAAGAEYPYLERLALRSSETPGARAMAGGLAEMGWQLVGITTAPQQPYRMLAEHCGWIQSARILGSPFPLREAEACLRSQGRWEREMGVVRVYVDDACELIDRHSELWMAGSGRCRQVSGVGRQLLRQRFQRFYREELDISYSPAKRASRVSATALGRIVEACAMVGDRAKAALALSLARRAGGAGRLVAMGDGANDAMMLRRAPWSIGVNGPDAARAARIGLITDDMRHTLVLLRLIEQGGDVAAVAGRAQAELRGAAQVHLGGEGLTPELEEQHRQMKRRLRGEFVTY